MQQNHQVASRAMQAKESCEKSKNIRIRHHFAKTEQLSKVERRRRSSDEKFEVAQNKTRLKAYAEGKNKKGKSTGTLHTINKEDRIAKAKKWQKAASEEES